MSKIIKESGEGELVFPPPIDTGIPIQPWFGQFLDGPEGWFVWDWYKDHDGPHALEGDACGCKRAVYADPSSGVKSMMFTIPCAVHYDPAKSWTANLAPSRATQG